MMVFAGAGQGMQPPAVRDADVPSLKQTWLGAVRDDTAFGNFERVAPDEMPAEARDEEAAFWQAVEFADLTPLDTFRQAASKNAHLTFGHLYGEPAKYRGQVVQFQGRLVRLKRLDPPHHAQLRGIPVLYEAWIYLTQPGSHPLCVIMPRQPDGILVGDGLNHHVTVFGYFFKRYRYLSGRLDPAGNNVALSTVMLICPTATLAATDGPPPQASTSAGPWWPWLVGFAAVIVVLMGCLTWWFRHQDQKVRTELERLRGARSL
jgi:hypothetical protein